MDAHTEPPPELAELLAQRHWARRLARSLVGDDARADDVTQDAFALALRQPRDHVRDWRAWLTTTLRRLATRERRSSARRVEREARAARPESDATHELAVRRAELQQELARAVLALAEPYRTTILLRYLEDLDVDTVAARTGVPAATVRTRTARALELLRARCAERDGGATLRGLALLAGAFDPASPAGLTSSTPPLAASVTGVAMKVTALLSALVLLALLLPFGWRALGANTPEPARALASDPGPIAPSAAHAVIDPPSDDARGLASSATPATTRAAERATPGSTRAAARLHGRVVAPGGAPLAGADVFLFDEPLVRPFEDARSDLRAVAQVTTDAGGTFAFEGLDAARTYDLVAQGDELPAARRSTPPVDVGAWEVPLGARVRGRVLDETTRAPVAGTELTFASARVAFGGYSAERSVTVGADGRFEVAGVAAGVPVTVSVGPPDALAFLARIDVGAPGVVERDVYVRGSAEIAGTVVDHETGAPVPGAVLRRAGAGARLAQADERGRFRCRVASGTDADTSSAASAIAEARGPVRLSPRTGAEAAQLEFHAPGWCVGRTGLAQAPRDANGELVLPLLRASRLTGVVLDARSTPVEGAVLGFGERPAVRWLDSVTARSSTSSRSVRTGVDGRFEFDEVPSGIDATLVVRHGARAPLSVADVLPRASGETRDIVVRVDDVARLRGTVRLNGAPHDAYVYVVRADGQLAERTRADASGRFTFEVLSAGEHALKACTSDGTAVWSEPRNVRLVTGGEGEIELDIASDLVHVRGRVLAAGGAPLAGVQVAAYAQSGDAGVAGMRTVAALARSRADGSFDVGLPARHADDVFELATFHGGMSFSVRDVKPGRDDVVFELPELARVVLHVVARDTGEPIERFTLAWIDPVTHTPRAYANGQEQRAAGGKLAALVPRGAIELVVGAPNAGFAPQTVRCVTESADATEAPTLTVELAR